VNSSSACGMTLDNQLFGDELAAGDSGPVQPVGLVQFLDDAAGVRCVGGLECFQGVFLGFLNVRADFVVIGCHVACSLSRVFTRLSATYGTPRLFLRRGQNPRRAAFAGHTMGAVPGAAAVRA